MKVLSTKTETTIVETSLYEIDGIDPSHAVLQRVTTYRPLDTLTKYSIKKTLEGEEYKDYKPLFVNSDFFDLIKTESPFDDSSKSNVFRIYRNKIDQTSLETPNGTQLVWVCFSDHTLLDSNLAPLPFCRSYGYFSNFSDKYIDLNEEFLEWLRNHPWVVNKKGIKVEEIPYYARGNDMTSYVPVSILPDKETYVEIFNFLKNRSGRYLCLSEVLPGSPSCPQDIPDWFGIRPWLRKPIP